MSELNKTVYLGNGSTMVCTYDSDDDLTLGPFWITVFAVSLLLNAFAVFGNSAVVIACFLQKRRPPFLVYIHALAISDLLYALVAPLYIYRYALHYMPQFVINFSLKAEFAHYVTAIANILSSTSCWLVVALTIDRAILTKLPIKASKLSTTRRALLAVFLIVFCCTAINGVIIYAFFEVPIGILPCVGYWFVPTEVTLKDGNLYTPLIYNSAYRIYDTIAVAFFFYAAPTTILISGNILIIRWIKKRKINNLTSMKQHTGKQRAHHQLSLTKMTIVVSILFIISNAPDVVTRILWKLLDPLIVADIEPISHLFLMVNVSANFVVYSCFNRYLFRTFIKMLKKCRRKEVPELSSSSGKQHNLSTTGNTCV